MWRQQCIWLAAAAVAAAPISVRAQASGEGFLFRDPSFTLSVYGGFARANAGSDLFEFSTDELTLDRSDFSGLDIGADFAFRINPRVDLVLGVARSGSNARSEFRDWTDADDLPIEQTTKFVRLPLSATLRYHLTPRGRSVGSFAWIPSQFVPWVGLGAGMMSYRFEQVGDFLEYQPEPDPPVIFTERYVSKGWTPMLQASVGGGLSLSPRWLLNGELRYLHAGDDLEGDFTGFDRVDLSGLSTSVGLALRF